MMILLLFRLEVFIDTVKGEIGIGLLITLNILGIPLEPRDNDDVYVIKGAPIPQGGSLEVMSGNKIVLQTSDALQCLASASNALDVVLSIMEIT